MTKLFTKLFTKLLKLPAVGTWRETFKHENMMEDRKPKIVAAAFVVMELAEEEPPNKKQGKTTEWLKRQEEKGMFRALIAELSVEDTKAYKEMMQMSHEDFFKDFEL